MIKLYYLFIIPTFLIFFSCEDPEEKGPTIGAAEIIILYPADNAEIIYNNEALEIKAIITNKGNASAGYIKIEGDIIASGLNDTITAYYEPASNINQNIQIDAELTDGENIVIGFDSHNISLNSSNSNTLSFETIFMNIDDQFQMMRYPVTNRQFMNFLNTNENLNTKIENIIWTDSDSDSYGNPELCEFDSGDNYEPTNWWYVSVHSDYASATIAPDEYIIYKNAYNIYDQNADFNGQAGRIRYDCLSESFYLPLEENGSESIYLDHPAVGVTWVGANIYANYFGWSIPSLEEWELAARGDNTNWLYPWGNEINQNYANFNQSKTSQIGYYNGLEDLNLSLSAYGIYDMGGNVWEYTSSSSAQNIFYKTGGAFNSLPEQLEIGYRAYALLEHVSNNTGFRCITDINYPSENPSGCITTDACNFDTFAQNSTNCYIDDCLNFCGGSATESIYYQDSDNDGLGNPDITEIQCNEPENGWVDNNYDLDDECLSSDVNQVNIDCNSICNGTAFYDGCNLCVGGNTEDEPCTSDCNGIEGGDAVWDDCNICSGGNTGIESNLDLDCNQVCAPYTEQGITDQENGLIYGAFIDDCGECISGGTGLDENYLDLGCGCNEVAKENYCLDEDSNNCCDCGNNTDGQWDECDFENDSELLCEDEVSSLHIQNIFGCSNYNAENYYCDEPENTCFSFGINTIPPCNFIDDNSCIIYGCSDSVADNYDTQATICSDGSQASCCEYTEPLQVSFGNVDLASGIMEINIIVPEYEDSADYVYGFQFEIEGITINGASGGLAADAGFTLSTGGATVLGFSFSGTYIDAGSGILTEISFTPSSAQACLNLGSGGFSNQNSQSIPVIFGECFDF